MRQWIDLFENKEVTVKHSDGKDTIRFIDSSGNDDLWKNKRIRYLNGSEALHEHHIILLDGDRIIGMTGLQVNPYNDKELWIKFVSVDPDYQGRGYGRKLIELIYQYAREKGLKPKSSSFTDMGEQRLKHIHAQMNEDEMNENEMIMFHGTNMHLTVLRPGSWVTDDPEAAKDFALEKSKQEGGKPIVYSLKVHEDDVDWDFLSNMAGVDDARGTLLRPVEVTDTLNKDN